MNTHQEDLDKTKLVIALRTARAITGWSQSEFAERMGLSQSAVTRMERKASDISFVLMHNAIKEYANAGVDIDILDTENLNVTVRPGAIKYYKERLNRNA